MTFVPEIRWVEWWLRKRQYCCRRRCKCPWRQSTQWPGVWSGGKDGTPTFAAAPPNTISAFATALMQGGRLCHKLLTSLFPWDVLHLHSYRCHCSAYIVYSSSSSSAKGCAFWRLNEAKHYGAEELSPLGLTTPGTKKQRIRQPGSEVLFRVFFQTSSAPSQPLPWALRPRSSPPGAHIQCQMGEGGKKGKKVEIIIREV